MIEKKILTCFDKTGCFIIINNGLHPDHASYYSKMVACTRTAFNQMINNVHIFEAQMGIKISDGYQNAWKTIKDIHHVKIDIEAMADFIVKQDMRAGKEQDYIEAEKEIENLEKEPEPKETENVNDTGRKTVAMPASKKRARTIKTMDV